MGKTGMEESRKQGKCESVYSDPIQLMRKFVNLCTLTPLIYAGELVAAVVVEVVGDGFRIGGEGGGIVGGGDADDSTRKNVNPCNLTPFMAEAEKKRKENQDQEASPPKARAA